MNKVQKRFKIILLISILFTITGCKTIPKNYKVSATYQKSLSKDKEIAVIIDMCILRDESGEDTDYFSVYSSKKAASLISEAIQNKLPESGYAISTISNDSMCDFYGKASKNINIVVNDGDEIIKSGLPYYYSDIDDKYKEALHNVLVRTKLSANKKNFSNIFFVNKNIIDDLKILEKHFNTDKLLILAIRGRDISASKSFGQGFSASLFGGKVQLEYLQTHGILIDIKNNQAIWTLYNVYRSPFLYDEEFYNTSYYSKTLKSLER